jgi:hypothetical protein
MRSAIYPHPSVVQRSGSAAVVIDYGLQYALKGHLRFEADELVDFLGIRYAARHVLEAFLVGLIVRHEDDLRVGAGQLLDLFRELQD